MALFVTEQTYARCLKKLATKLVEVDASPAEQEQATRLMHWLLSNQSIAEFPRTEQSLYPRLLIPVYQIGTRIEFGQERPKDLEEKLIHICRLFF